MQTVLITGASGLLGREFVRQYAADGWLIYATALDPSGLSDLAAEYPNVRPLALDVTDFARVREVAREIDGSIDLLISNAAFYSGLFQHFGETDYTDLRRMLETNLVAPLHLAESFAPAVERSQWKKMVFVSARQGSTTLNVTGGAYGYRSSKAGLNACVKSMSIDLLHRGIAVLALHPGAVSGNDDPQAPLSAAESVEQMRKVIRRFNLHETGSFLMFNDNVLPW